MRERTGTAIGIMVVISIVLLNIIPSSILMFNGIESITQHPYEGVIIVKIEYYLTRSRAYVIQASKTLTLDEYLESYPENPEKADRELKKAEIYKLIEWYK